MYFEPELGHKDIDVNVIPNFSNHTKLSMAKRKLQAGQNVLTEKYVSLFEGIEHNKTLPIVSLANDYLREIVDFRSHGFTVSRYYLFAIQSVDENRKRVIPANFGWTINYCDCAVVSQRFVAALEVKKAILKIGRKIITFSWTNGLWQCLAKPEYNLIDSPDGEWYLEVSGNVPLVYVFTKSGLLHWRKEGNITLEYFYDEFNLLTHVQNNQGKVMNFLYDVYGLPIGIACEGRKVNYYYDEKQRLTKVTFYGNQKTTAYREACYGYDDKEYPMLLTRRVVDNTEVMKCQYLPREKQFKFANLVKI